jgi:hypothetical protein
MLRLSLACNGLAATSTDDDATPLYVQEQHGADAAAAAQAQTVHVTEVTAHNEDCCRLLDRVAREHYKEMDSRINTVDVLQAPAGSGKSQSNIDLAHNLLQKQQVQKVLMVAFNKAAVRDGEARTKSEPRIVWRTIDSLVWELFKSDFKDQESVDLDDCMSIAQTATRLLEMPLYPEEADDFRLSLSHACTVGSPAKLRGDALTLYQKGLRGMWWSFSMLRVRALSHSGWPLLFSDYQTVIVDEAQDLNVVMLKLLRQLHAAKHMVYSMDRAQKLYGFMQCVNITDHLEPSSYRFWKFYLTYRYGAAVCKLVNDRCLPQYCTFAAEGTPDTRIHHVDDSFIVPGAHTWIVNSWFNILETADRLLAAKRAVRMDADKRDELLAASQSETWTKHDKALFKKLEKYVVFDVVSRVQQNDECSPDEIYLTTPHGYKGLQTGGVRVSRCIMEAKTRDGSSSDDIERKIYVSVTRGRHDLYLPAARQMKRKR